MFSSRVQHLVVVQQFRLCIHYELYLTIALALIAAAVGWESDGGQGEGLRIWHTVMLGEIPDNSCSVLNVAVVGRLNYLLLNFVC